MVLLASLAPSVSEITSCTQPPTSAALQARRSARVEVTCYVDNDGKLGVFLSARRFKTDIADMDNASAGLLALRSVTFRYKPELDKTGIPQFGLIAEEVAK